MARVRTDLTDDSDYFRDLRAAADAPWDRYSRNAPLVDSEGQRLAVPAPNAIEWVVGREWCNAPSTYEIWGQYQVIRDFFELRCPMCNEGDGNCWGKSRTQLEDELLLRWSLEYEEDVCPRCKITRSELLEDGYLHGFNQLHLVVGQRAGKSICAALIGTYVEHRILTLGLATAGGFHGYLGITPAEVFEMTFLAATDVQSQDTIWTKYTGFRTDSPWFQRYVPWVKKQEEAQLIYEGMKPWFYKETEKRIVNMHPSVRLLCNSLNSNAPGLRGRTRPAAFADEISHMQQSDSKQSATEVYRALERSLRTVRSRVKRFGGLPWLGLMGSVTSPATRDDKGMQLLRDADRVPSMYAKHFPTWEFNPYEPRENFDEEFAKDPVGAERDYGANPPGAEHPLIHDEVKWRSLVTGAQAPRAEFEVYERIGKLGHRYTAVRLKRADLVRDGRSRYVVFDAGANFDAFAGACGHREYETDSEGREHPITVIDWVVRIVPRQGTEVYFDSVVDLLVNLKPMMPIVRVEFDRWQSIQLIQNIRELGIFAEKSGTTHSDFTQFRLDSFANRVRLLPPLAGEFKPDTGAFAWNCDPPELSPQAAGIYEILGLQCDPDSNKVSNPRKGLRRGWNSDDTAQCIVHVNRLVQSQGYTERQDDRSARAVRQRAEEGGRDWGNRGFVANTPAGAGAARNWHGSKRGW